MFGVCFDGRRWAGAAACLKAALSDYMNQISTHQLIHLSSPSLDLLSASTSTL
jgi:hypothetical protein